MALVKCPNCGKPISDKAEKCIHCGVMIDKENEYNTEQDVSSIVETERFREIKSDNSGKILVVVFISFIVFLVVFIVGFIAYRFYISSDANEVQTTSSINEIHSEQLDSIVYDTKEDDVTERYDNWEPSGGKVLCKLPYMDGYRFIYFTKKEEYSSCVMVHDEGKQTHEFQLNFEYDFPTTSIHYKLSPDSKFLYIVTWSGGNDITNQCLLYRLDLSLLDGRTIKVIDCGADVSCSSEFYRVIRADLINYSDDISRSEYEYQYDCDIFDWNGKKIKTIENIEYTDSDCQGFNEVSL